MSCVTVDEAIENIKSSYHQLKQGALAAQAQGRVAEASENYQKALFRARMLFRLPRIPIEAIGYLVDALTNCVDHCWDTDKTATDYLEIAGKDLLQLLSDHTQPVDLRAEALAAYVQVNGCIVQEMHESDQMVGIEPVMHKVAKVWQRYSPALVQVH